jgi:hypothetical protein
VSGPTCWPVLETELLGIVLADVGGGTSRRPDPGTPRGTSTSLQLRSGPASRACRRTASQDGGRASAPWSPDRPGSRPSRRSRHPRKPSASPGTEPL